MILKVCSLRRCARGEFQTVFNLSNSVEAFPSRTDSAVPCLASLVMVTPRYIEEEASGTAEPSRNFTLESGGVVEENNLNRTVLFWLRLRPHLAATVSTVVKRPCICEMVLAYNSVSSAYSMSKLLWRYDHVVLVIP